MAASSACFLDDHLSLLLSEDRVLAGPDSASPNHVVRGRAAANLNAPMVVVSGIAAVNGGGSGIATVDLRADAVVREEEVLVVEPDSQSLDLNANAAGSGVGAVDLNANPVISGIGAVNDQFSSWAVELGDDEVWPSSSFAGSLNFDSDSSFLFEIRKWPRFDSTPPSPDQQSVTDANQSCASDPLPCPAAGSAPSFDSTPPPSGQQSVHHHEANQNCAGDPLPAHPPPAPGQLRLCPRPPPALHACLLRRILLKPSRPAATSSAVEAAPPTSATSTTTVRRPSAPPSSLKRKRPDEEEGRPATSTYSKTHHNPPRENITSAAPPPRPSLDAMAASKHSSKSPSSKVSSESLRRRKMTGLFSTLRTLLPKRPLHQKDHCITINEACDYIHSLEKQLHILKVKMYILNSLLVLHTNQNSMPFKEGYDNQDCEFSRQVQISAMKYHDMIYITIGCCEKIHGLFSNIIIILEQCGLEVIDANLSKGKDTIVYVFCLKVTKNAPTFSFI